MKKYPTIIGVKNLKITGFFGVSEEEREKLQELLIDLEVLFDRESVKDSIEKTIDYTSLCLICHELAKRQKWRLLETYAEGVMKKCFSFINVHRVKIRVKKQCEEIRADWAFVELERKRKERL